MQSEIKRCQNCKQEFTIEPDDFVFYEKIDVPPPTWCPECRLIRRLCFNNQRSLYKRECNLCKNATISMYSSDAPFPVYCPRCWWSDDWDPMEYGREYDFSKSLLEQIRELQLVTPVPALSTRHQTLTNSEYVNMAHNLKNCYLLFNSDYDEGCAYGSEVENSEDSFDMMMAESCHLSYESINCIKCYRTFFSVDCKDSQDIWFSRNLVNCTNCFGCTNLRNKKYYIFNEPHTEEEYLEKLKEFNLGSKKSIQTAKEKALELHMKFPRKFMHGSHNVDVSGDYVHNSKDVHNTFIGTGSEHCRYCMWLIIKGNKDCYDFTQFGENTQNVYETVGSGINLNNVKFSAICVGDVHNVEYTQHCFGGAYLLACIGLRNKQHCILNKQYSKESFDKLRAGVIEHMNTIPYTDNSGRTYRYGEFFPSELSPFAYNETIAQEYFPLTKKEAEEQGYLWREPDTKDHKITKNVDSLPDHISDIDDGILKETIGCEHEGKCNEQCTTAFKVISSELQFYKKMNLPLPRLCPNCRHYQRLKQRNPLQLCHRKCTCDGVKSENGAYKNTAEHFHGTDHCPNEFETPYAPERKEIVYCEQCYQTEVV
ncbi:MAG TPA: hypothetical protein ENH86_02370 [Candidatus Jorgensenbacteria bacterium]|nr:hypothetical protein [Candidatus Jorgensenbacteria bacterium]